MNRVSSLRDDVLLYQALPFGGQKRCYLDDVASAESGAVLTRDGRVLRASADVVEQVRRALDVPALSGTFREVGQHFGAWLSQPHPPLKASTSLLAAAEKLHASDVHLEFTPEGAALRLRIHGALQDFCVMPRGAAERMVAALKGLSGCLPYRSDVVQEGRIARDGVGSDIRTSFLTALGERAALRLFGALRTLDTLGLPTAVLTTFRSALELRGGLILIAGGTGAGKTTTLYAALGEIASTRKGAHLSLEDPVEQRLRHVGIAVDQVELDPTRGITGESMLSAALRQDVDVISVGEIRSAAEASLALQAAHTGRLVLAGIHAGSCLEAQVRMTDLGVDRPMLKRTLRGVLHQKLVAVTCDCAGACARCHGTGHSRRVDAQWLAQGALRDVEDAA